MVVIGGTILAGGRGGVWGTLAGVILFGTLDAVFNMVGIDAFVKQVLRGGIVIAAVAVYAVRTRGHRGMIETTEPRPISPPRERRRRCAAWPRSARPIVVLIALLVAIAVASPAFLEPQGYMNFLRRAAPLVILAAGQLFVIVVGGFDLSVGSLITLVVMASSMLIQRRPGADLVGDRRWSTASASPSAWSTGWWSSWLQGAVDHRHAGHAAGAEGRRAGLVRRVAAGLPARQFPRFRPADLARRAGDRPAAAGGGGRGGGGGAAVVADARHRAGAPAAGRRRQPARRRSSAGTRVRLVRIIAFIVSALSAVTAGILLGGFAGVSTDVGDGYELQAIAAS